MGKIPEENYYELNLIFDFHFLKKAKIWGYPIIKHKICGRVSSRASICMKP